MARFVASDIHFSHRNILQYCPHRVHESFTDDIKSADDLEIDFLIELMNEKIISNWNGKVEPDDDVFILGDVAMGKIALAPALIRRLNGRKYLIKGNHDVSLTKLITKDNSLTDLFVWIKDYHEMSHALPGINQKKNLICMSHFPFLHFNGQNQGTLHLHGHLHSAPENRFRLGKRMMDVGIDGNNLHPYLLDDVVRQCLVFPFGNSHHE